MVTLRNAAGSDEFLSGRSLCGMVTLLLTMQPGRRVSLWPESVWIVNTRKNLLLYVTKFRGEVRAVFRYCWNIKHRDTISVQFFRGHSISQSHYKVTKTPACNICAVLSIKNVSAFLPRRAWCEAPSLMRGCDPPKLGRCTA